MVEKVKFETIKGKSKFNPIYKVNLEKPIEYKITTEKEKEITVTLNVGDVLKITSVTGHVSSFDYPPPFDKKTSWDQSDPLDLVDLNADEFPINQYLASQLQELGISTTHLIIATDWDPQGESIGAQIKRYVELGRNGSDINTSRMRFTATNVPSLMGSFKNQFQIDNSLVSSVDSLRRQDLRMGASLTRFLTVGIQKLGFNRLISYGPCQTSVLWIITNRFQEKQDFVPEPFWEIYAERAFDLKQNEDENSSKSKKAKKKKKTKKKATKKTNKKSNNPDDESLETIRFSWIKNPLTSKTKLNSIVKKLGKTTTARLLSQEVVSEIIKRPIPLDTDTLESECARLFRVSPKLIADLAEKLYNNGFITYPRTESSYYLLKDLTPLCERFVDNETFSSDANLCLSKGDPKNPSKGRFTKDHEPISPVKSVEEKEIRKALKGNDFESSIAWRIYEYIVRRFFATIHKDGKIKVTTTKIDVKGEEFSHEGRKIASSGFLDVFPYRRVAENPTPKLQENEEFNVTIKNEKKFTEPPELWTESRIIREMARLNIGTDATRSQHISTVIERGFARVQTGTRTLIPTEIGISFYNIFTNFAEQLILPEIRETVEKWTHGIRTGENTPEDVDEKVIDLTKTSLIELKSNQSKIFELFSESIKESTSEGEEFGICPKCEDRLILKSSVKGKRYLQCANEDCDTTFALPKKGVLKLLPEKCHACPMYPLQVGTGTKSWIFCPSCWVERQDKEGLLFCSRCQYESCPYSQINNNYSAKQEKGRLGECPICNKGEIVLFFDEWRTKLECNNEKCNAEYKAPNIRVGTSIQIDLKCKLCGLSTLLIKRKGKATYNMCPVCSLLCFQCIHRCFG